MDDKKRARREEKAAGRPVPPGGSGGEGEAGATQSPSRKAPLPLRDAATAPPADDEPADIGGGGIVEDEDDDDDEKVERFYALLANIRAMRGLLPPCVASVSSCGGDAGGDGPRKRLRAAEPPWRPAFRMEDFEVVEPAAAPAAPPSKREQQTKAAAAAVADDDDHGESVVVAPSPSVPHAAARWDSGSYKD